MTAAILTAPATPVEFFQWWQGAAAVFRQRGMTSEQLLTFRERLADRFYNPTRYTLVPEQFGLGSWGRSSMPITWVIYVPTTDSERRILHPLFCRGTATADAEEVLALVDFVELLNFRRSTPGSRQFVDMLP